MDIKTAKKVHSLIENLNNIKDKIETIRSYSDYDIIIKSDHGHQFAYITDEVFKKKIFDLLLDEFGQRKHLLRQQLREIE